MKSPTRLNNLYEFLASRNFALVLFGVSCIVFIGTSIASQKKAFETPVHNILLGLIGLNLLLCTMLRIRTLSRPVLIMHAGVFLTLIGGLIGALGFTATVNTYEKEPVDRVYRWDKKEDVPLDFGLIVTKIHTLYYPIPVKVGVLRGNEKVGLFTLRTGEDFNVDGYTVRADNMEMPAEILHLTVFDQGRFLCEADTSGADTLPAGFPYSFVLVAYKNPVLKRTWIDLMLTHGSEILAEGESEVNSPFTWNGLYFYHTQNDVDPYGNLYAGVQIVKDPGRPVVFTGFGVILIGLLFWLYKKFHGRPKLPARVRRPAPTVSKS